MNINKFNLFVVLILSLLDVALFSKSAKKKTEPEKVTLSTESVLTRGLVSEKVKGKEILKEHASYCEICAKMKTFEGDTLAYVTPWNNHGYDVAKWFARKFTYVSPVWLQIKRHKRGKFEMQGGHDIDKGWVKDVTKGDFAKMAPRVLFDGWRPQDYKALFSSEDEIEDCIDTILKFIQKYKFSGVVIEIWSQLQGAKKELIHFLQHFGETFKKNNKKFILVVPPPLYAGDVPGTFSKSDFDALEPMVDSFSLMTYDYSNPGRPGPNSPIDWMKACVEALVPSIDNLTQRRKILLGLNFYGNEYHSAGGGPVVGNQYLEILRKHKPKLKWDSTTAEHIGTYETVHGQAQLYYPTLKSIQERLDLARTLQTGVSIWEIGQGLDYFYDLL